jgi:hypothetical protein
MNERILGIWVWVGLLLHIGPSFPKQPSFQSLLMLVGLDSKNLHGLGANLKPNSTSLYEPFYPIYNHT